MSEERWCSHEHVVDPPPGKVLRVCLDCCKRLIECDHCNAVITARPDIADSGWMRTGVIDYINGHLSQSWCPRCWAGRRG